MNKFLKSSAINIVCSILCFYLAWDNFSESGINALVIVQVLIAIYILVRPKLERNKNKDK
ncbi:MAG: hypothetical protein R3Y09_04575 [Clostridia bacterium]